MWNHPMAVALMSQIFVKIFCNKVHDEKGLKYFFQNFWVKIKIRGLFWNLTQFHKMASIEKMVYKFVITVTFLFMNQFPSFWYHWKDKSIKYKIQLLKYWKYKYKSIQICTENIFWRIFFANFRNFL